MISILMILNLLITFQNDIFGMRRLYKYVWFKFRFISLLQALYETLYMVTVSLVIGALIGIPLGILLVVTRKRYMVEYDIASSIKSYH